MARFELNELIQWLYEAKTVGMRVTDVGSSLQKRLDYDVRTDSNPVYIGYGAQGLAAGTNGWLLNKITYDGSDRITLVQSTIDTWNNRASASYS